jgi:hypothetical protein
VPDEPVGDQPRQEDAVKTPAGWYDDPASPGRRRYWDGSQWTDHYAAGAQAMPPTQQMPAPLGAAPRAPTPAPTRSLKWWQKTGGVVGIGAVAGIVGLAIGAGAGASSSKTTTETNTTTDTMTQTVAQTVTQKPKSVAPASAPSPSGQASGGGGSATQHFSGSGQKSLGTITVPVDSTLSWSCAGCSSTNFIINNAKSDDNSIPTNGFQQTHGVDPLPAGTYHTVVVDTTGSDWTIDIKPG